MADEFKVKVSVSDDRGNVFELSRRVECEGDAVSTLRIAAKLYERHVRADLPSKPKDPEKTIGFDTPR